MTGFVLPWGRIMIATWLIIISYGLAPTSFWFVLHSVEVTDQHLGPPSPATRIMNIRREIKHSFTGTYRVEEQRLQKDGWLTVSACESPKPIPYEPFRSLPDPVQASWWSYGKCGAVPDTPALPDAYLRLCTTHQIIPWRTFPMLSKWTRPVCSNTYRGRILPEAAQS